MYLSNYAGIPHSYVILPLQESPTLFICFGLHITNARECAAIEDVRIGGFDLIPSVAERLKELGLIDYAPNDEGYGFKKIKHTHVAYSMIAMR